jgi:hypothetical protein
MIRKSGYWFSEKIMLKQQAKAKYRVEHFALMPRAAHASIGRVPDK